MRGFRFATSFRPLILFWASTIGLAVGSAVGLQFMGPVRAAIELPPPGQAIVQQGARAASLRVATMRPSLAHPVPSAALTAASIPEPDPAMLEPSPDFPDRMLPRNASADRPARRFFAAAFDPAERHPRVALVIDGAGLDEALTQQAMASLPSAIDLAFSAYAPPERAARLAASARQSGRECLVSVPMEPNGFPAAEEGDHALLTGNAPAQNQEALGWALSSVNGCVGATGGSDGLNGERFAENDGAFGDMLASIDQRGLLYLASQPAGIARLQNPAGAAPYVATEIVDAAATPEQPADAEAIDRHLAELTSTAARTGSAIGLAGPPTPLLLDRIAVWSHGLAAQGIVLAPLSAMPALPLMPALSIVPVPKPASADASR